ncbi:hypothetical protein COO60DRAFT_1699647 [Scenedesmus sp. NREL 46B-D3]|nr:hypothetical protein COO60DRAFT_1699647 [Scenedesmus sp. NREL 46B-D3]
MPGEKRPVKEVSTGGQRVFIVSSAELFWQHYKALPVADRHHYEIIRQASPCHLYFDLEFCPASNPGLDGAALVVLLLAGVAQQLQQLFGVPWHDSYALELDSSTPHKFSRHLLVRLPGMAFADACHAGRFARLVLLRLLARGGHSSQACGLLVRNREGDGFSAFVDMGVYTRNRAFRLYLSSKYGKAACLRLTNRFGGATLDPQAAFGWLLISVLHHTSSSCLAPLAAAAAAGSAELAAQRQQQWHKGAAASSCRTGEKPGKSICTSSSSSSSLGKASKVQRLEVTGQQGSSLRATACQRQQQGGGVQGQVRSWLRLPGSLVLNMKHNRWCGNVERAHKSNGIYYVADLREGTYYQKCYDPECRSYRSACMPLPSHVWQQCRQHAAEDASAAALQTNKRMAAAAALKSFRQPQQQQQQRRDEVQGGAAEEEDEQCLQLLQQLEGQQGADGCEAAALRAAVGVAAVQQSCLYQSTAGGNAEGDEYMQCLQLLQEVEGDAVWAADIG